MVPEVIDWEVVRCVSIEGRSIRFLRCGQEQEIIFPSDEALQEALLRWTVRSGEATEFFRKHDFRSRES